MVETYKRKKITKQWPTIRISMKQLLILAMILGVVSCRIDNAPEENRRATTDWDFNSRSGNDMKHQVFFVDECKWVVFHVYGAIDAEHSPTCTNPCHLEDD